MQQDVQGGKERRSQSPSFRHGLAHEDLPKTKEEMEEFTKSLQKTIDSLQQEVSTARQAELTVISLKERLSQKELVLSSLQSESNEEVTMLKLRLEKAKKQIREKDDQY